MGNYREDEFQAIHAHLRDRKQIFNPKILTLHFLNYDF